MGKIYSAVLTNAGAAALAAAAGAPVTITTMAAGDGNGVVPQPDPSQTGLVNELYRARLNRLSIADAAQNIVEAEMTIPPEIGGFWLREVALFDDAGACLAVANMPPSYKSTLAEGSGKYQVIRLQLAVSSTADVEMLVSPSVVIATVQDVLSAGNGARDYADGQLADHAASRDHPTGSLTDVGFLQLSSSTHSLDESKAATPKAVKAAYDLAAEKTTLDIIYPVGIVAWLAQNKNPNTLWSGTKWAYLGENRTIRLGKPDGSDIMQTGGADSVTLQKAHLPDITLAVTGTAADTDLGTKQTSLAGKHGHSGKFQPSNTSLDSGESTRRSWASDYAVNSEALIQEAPDHQHEVVIGPHGHAVNGSTAALGSGNSLNITNSFIKLMGWYRTA